jgi:hypothetical protein
MLLGRTGVRRSRIIFDTTTTRRKNSSSSKSKSSGNSVRGFRVIVGVRGLSSRRRKRGMGGGGGGVPVMTTKELEP